MCTKESTPQTLTPVTELTDGTFSIDCPFSTSFFDGSQEDDTTTIYSYFSALSTNYTASNLPGPGCLLGNLYSKAGSALERGLGRLVYRRYLKENTEELTAYMVAMAMLKDTGKIYAMLESEDPRENERACEILMIYAQYVFSARVFQFRSSLIRELAIQKIE